MCSAWFCSCCCFKRSQAWSDRWAATYWRCWRFCDVGRYTSHRILFMVSWWILILLLITVLCSTGTWRVGGVLAVSRAFGDKLLKQYVVVDPEIRVRNLGHFTISFFTYSPPKMHMCVRKLSSLCSAQLLSNVLMLYCLCTSCQHCAI